MATEAVSIVCVMALAATIAGAEETDADKKPTRHATITCDGEATYNWKTGETEFTDNCRLEIRANETAEMTADHITAVFNGEGFEIKQMEATGGVEFNIRTKADESGVRRVIDASCTDRAVFTGETQTMKLIGNAKASMKTEPKQAGGQPGKLDARQIIINLRTGDISAIGPGVHLEADIPTDNNEKEKKKKDETGQ